MRTRKADEMAELCSIIFDTYIFIYRDIFDESAADTIEKSGASSGKVFETLFLIWIWSKSSSILLHLNPVRRQLPSKWNATILKRERYTLYAFMWWDIMMMRCCVDCEPLALHLKIVSNWFWSGAWQCNQWQVLCNILPSNTPHLPHPPPRLFHLVASLALPPWHSSTQPPLH